MFVLFSFLCFWNVTVLLAVWNARLNCCNVCENNVQIANTKHAKGWQTLPFYSRCGLILGLVWEADCSKPVRTGWLPWLAGEQLSTAPYVICIYANEALVSWRSVLILDSGFLCVFYCLGKCQNRVGCLWQQLGFQLVSQCIWQQHNKSISNINDKKYLQSSHNGHIRLILTWYHSIVRLSISPILELPKGGV